MVYRYDQVNTKWFIGIRKGCSGSWIEPRFLTKTNWKNPRRVPLWPEKIGTLVLLTRPWVRKSKVSRIQIEIVWNSRGPRLRQKLWIGCSKIGTWLKRQKMSLTRQSFKDSWRRGMKGPRDLKRVCLRLRTQIKISQWIVTEINPSNVTSSTVSKLWQFPKIR